MLKNVLFGTYYCSKYMTFVTLINARSYDDLLTVKVPIRLSCAHPVIFGRGGPVQPIKF